MNKYSLALVAHDAKKLTMVDLVKKHRERLADLNLVATRTTGQLIKEKVNLPVTLFSTKLTPLESIVYYLRSIKKFS